MIPRFNYSPSGIAGYNMRETSSLTIPVQHSTGDAVNTSACAGLGDSSGEFFVAGHTHLCENIFINYSVTKGRTTPAASISNLNVQQYVLPY